IIAKPETELNIYFLCVPSIVAGILGDMVNYHIGKFVGPKAFSGKYKLLKKENLDNTQAFYYKHRRKTIIYARCISIVRTFAPFIAGIGTVSYSRFCSYSVVGAVAWVTSFLFLGYFFGGLPILKDSFSMVIFAIIVLSVLP